MASIKRIGTDNNGIPVWEAIYRRTSAGKQVRRRFHLPTKMDVERAIFLDSQRSDIGLRWSEGTKIYLDAKRLEDRSPLAMEHVERAAAVFIEIMGDIAIEETTAEKMKEFMQAASKRPVKHRFSGKQFRVSGPKVANRHRKELLTVARYLLRHTGKINDVPFKHVPPLPVKHTSRAPIPFDKISDYLDALPPHTRRPIQMVFFYGLRSSAACNLTLESIDGPNLVAVDKGEVERRIPIDDLLANIIADAMAYRKTFEDMKPEKRKPGAPADNLFLNMNGRGWTRMTLLHAAQRAWDRAGLEKKKIHEVRHTLGTIAGKNFTPGMVQAVMGHRSRKSAEAYFHPTEEMASEVRQKIVTELSQTSGKTVQNGQVSSGLVKDEEGVFSCPCCGHNLFIVNKKTRKPLPVAGFEILERAKGIEPS